MQDPFSITLKGTFKQRFCHWLTMSGFAFEEKDALNVFSANIQPNQNLTETYIKRIFQPASSALEKLPLLVQGPNFQLKVWEALLSIPNGAVTTYQQIAQSIGNPAAVRAVGTAVGDNPIAYLIPCHRVIRKEGVLGEYRWGSLRKKALIGWEAARSMPSAR